MNIDRVDENYSSRYVCTCIQGWFNSTTRVIYVFHFLLLNCSKSRKHDSTRAKIAFLSYSLCSPPDDLNGHLHFHFRCVYARLHARTHTHTHIHAGTHIERTTTGRGSRTSWQIWNKQMWQARMENNSADTDGRCRNGRDTRTCAVCTRIWK